MAEEYAKENHFHRHGRREKLRHPPTKRKTIPVSLVCICLTLIVAACGFWWYGYRNAFEGRNRMEQPIMAKEQGAKDFSYSVEIQDDCADEKAWSLILVNKRNPIPDDYPVELTQLSNGQCVDTRIYPALQEMLDAARAEGVHAVVASGYRTTEKQQSLMDGKIADYVAEGYSETDAKTEAEAWVAIPGTSEHQLGIAVDINADGVYSSGNAVYEWLNQNCYQFGFILRYPSDKTEITKVIYEPWHYRYVGIETATELYNQGLCLEEYLDQTK